MKRYIQENISTDLEKKMVFITGPRQVGKTYLSKSLLKDFSSSAYLNYDDLDNASIIKKKLWPHHVQFIIFDEIHKMKNWKQFLKGVFDTRPNCQRILVTGSSRLETFRQTGESLAGRYFHYRLNPLSVKELAGTIPADEALFSLLKLGGFPEPFLSGSEQEAQRWRKQYYKDIIREDILDFSRIHEIRSLRLLLEMLRRRVGSPISYSSLSGDLQIAPNTIRKYISILESLYIIFCVRPFHANIARAILKEPKIYFYDSGFIDGDEGIKLENTVALCLLKHVQYLEDTTGREISLHYLRTKDGKEIDFVLADQKEPTHFIEVKSSTGNLSKSLILFKQKFPQTSAVQLVLNLPQAREEKGILITRCADWLTGLSA